MTFAEFIEFSEQPQKWYGYLGNIISNNRYITKISRKYEFLPEALLKINVS